MYDVVIRGGELIDGTGAPRRRATSAIQGDRIVAIGAIDDRRRDGDRRHRQGGHARVRRRAHPLRRAGVLGRRAHAVAPARCHHRLGRQLRLHHRAAVGRSRRRRLPHAHAGASRGHASGIAARRRAVELDHHRRVLRPDRRPPGDQRRLHGRPLGDPAHRDGRGVDRPRSQARRDRADAGALLRVGLEAGAFGFSSSWARTHNDADGHMVPSRFATRDEIVALCE